MSLKGQQTALLLIDLQNGFYHPDSAMGKSVGVGDRQSTIPVIGNLVEFARSKNMSIFWSRQIHFEGDVTRKRKVLKNHMQKQKFTPCLKGTFETEFYAPFEKMLLPDDHVIEKHRASLFFDTNLSTKLRMLDIKNLVIAGCNTEFCVAHTVRDAYARDYEIVVVEDATAGIDPTHHQNCLDIFQSYFAEVVLFEKLGGIF